ncbi:Lead, cadmium, zinc and mercury transporting ATPase [Lachnospiraceae bacterium TWA4]|nr:Lead, cadmium, zinc and mercury transporting ATPase [Lachnospiraceae bacterium TWA4]
MRFQIKHQIKGRMRIHLMMKCLTSEEADIVQYFLECHVETKQVKVYSRTADVVISYNGTKDSVITALKEFDFSTFRVPEDLLENSGRKMNDEYKEKLVIKVVSRGITKWVLPTPIRTVYTVIKSFKYIKDGIKCLFTRGLEVPVLDATAIGVSIARRDYSTAGSVMFLLGVGELLEEWTHKKSVGDLARSMSLNIGKVWVKYGEQIVAVNPSRVCAGDEVIVCMGNQIPFDGEVLGGEAMVNQASLTGESVPVKKDKGGTVYAGTVVEEGELRILVKEAKGATRYEKIVQMIEESEKLKSEVESKSEHLADKLVPYTFLGTGLTWLITRNVTKTLSVLMVDFSCALKLAIPITVISAMREASSYKVTVKGGKYLEALATADTIVFDKTGTLTKACPTVKEVISLCETSPDELLRISACLEEHFPHSMATAVVDAALEKGLEHEEMHSKVDYIVAHGIASCINHERVVIGSYHFVFEDEACIVREEYKEQLHHLPEECSYLYLAINGIVSAIICIEDPLRKEAKDVVRSLKEAGFSKVVMMTGDSDKTAKAIAKRVGVDEYYSEVLPEDKANFVLKEKEKGRIVAMVGDGINDSPALSAADIGMAISDGAAIAREIADITVEADRLDTVVTLRNLSTLMMKRIHSTHRTIMTVNGGLIALGVLGIIPPTTSALLHNGTTLALSLNNMKNLI